MTVQGCVEACHADYWTSAGIEYGRECYCDNRTYTIGESWEPVNCNMPCDGDASQSVPVPYLLSVLSLTVFEMLDTGYTDIGTRVLRLRAGTAAVPIS